MLLYKSVEINRSFTTGCSAEGFQKRARRAHKRNLQERGADYDNNSITTDNDRERHNLPFGRSDTNLTLPDWELAEQKPIGKYGLLRLDYLKNNHRATYQAMLLRGTLNAHLSETDETANRRLDEIMPRLAKSAGVTEKLKAENLMKWVGLMNTLKAQAEETVLDELIYC